MATIVVRNKYVEVPDALAQTFAGLGAEQYLRIEEMWRRDQQEQWAARAGQQQAQSAPQQPRQAPRVSVDQEAERRAEAREVIAEMARSRGQTAW